MIISGRGDIMGEKILNLLTEINKDLKNMKLDMTQFKTEMHNRFDKIDAKLDGVGG